MRRVAAPFVLALLALLAAGPVRADQVADGLAAYRQHDYAPALKDWKPLAEAGDARGEYGLALLCKHGRGVPQDFAATAALFRKAAGQGFAPAQARLAGLYATGSGVALDVVTATMWAELAAKAGSKGAAAAAERYAARLSPEQKAAAAARARACLAARFRGCD